MIVNELNVEIYLTYRTVLRLNFKKFNLKKKRIWSKKINRLNDDKYCKGPTNLTLEQLKMRKIKKKETNIG